MNLVVTALRRLTRYLLVLVACLSIGFLVLLFGSRAQVNEQLRASIAAVASENTGLAIEVGQVRGSWWSGVTLHDIKVHATSDPRSEVLASTPLIQAGYAMLTLIGGRPAPIRLDIYHANVHLVVGKNRLFNLQPRIRAPHDEKAGEPVPTVEMVFHGGHVAYGDFACRKPFMIEVGNLGGHGRLVGFDLDLDLQVLRENDVIQAQVAYDLQHQRGTCRVNGRGLSLPYWVNRFAFAPEYDLLAGKVDLQLTAAWQDPMLMEELKLSGVATMWGGVMRLKNVATPVTDLQGKITFDQDQATLSGMRGELSGMPLEIGGQVREFVRPVPALGYPDMALALAILAPRVELDRLHEPFPGLASLGLAGVGTIHSSVSGTVSNPKVVMRGHVAAGRWGKERVRDVAIDATYTTGRFDLPRFELGLAEGRARGRAFVGIPADPKAELPYTVDLRFQGLRLAQLLDRYLAEPLFFAIDGDVTGEYHLRGAGSRALTDVVAGLENGVMDGQAVRACHLTYRHADTAWQIPSWTLDWGASHLDAALTGTDEGAFHLNFKIPRGELSQWVNLNADPPKMVLRGAMQAEGELKGKFGRPATWLGRAGIDLTRARMSTEAIDRASARMTVANNRMVVEDLSAHTLRGVVRGSGTYIPFLAVDKEYPVTRLELRATDFELGALSTLAPSWRDLRGRASGRAVFLAQRGDFELSGQATATRVRHPAWGHLDRLRASFIYTPCELALLPLTWHPGDGLPLIRATGAIQLDPAGGEPAYNLQVETHHADVKTLLGAVHWPAVMSRLAPPDAVTVAALGPVRSRGTLPATSEGGGFVGWPMLDQLDHWQTWRKQPLDRPPPAPAILPFWEGTTGWLDLTAHLEGPASHPRVSLDATLERLTVFERLLDRAALTASWTGERLAIPMLRLVEGGRTVLTAGGALAVRGGEKLVIRTHGLDLGWTDRALASGHRRLIGRADLNVTLSGRLHEPRLACAGSLGQGRFVAPDLDPIDFDEVQAQLAYERGVLAISRAMVRQKGQQATITGTVPVGVEASTADDGRDAMNLALRLEDDNVGIINLFSQGRFQWLGGKGFIEMRLGGTAMHPTVAGHIDLSEGRFKAKGLVEPVENFQADVVLGDEKIDVKTIKGRYGGGDVELLGEVFWDQFKPRRFNLSAIAKPFRLLLTNDYYHGMVEANLRLAGAVAQPVLSGQVALWDGQVALREAASRPAGTELEPVALRLSNLIVSLGPSLRIKNSLMDVNVTTQQRQGFLAVDGSLAAPKPRGVVIIEGGTINPLNNPFKIVEGKVEFLGEKVNSGDELLEMLSTSGPRPDEATSGLNGRLDVSARTTVYDYSENETVNVLAHVTGALDRMEMRFTSEPIRSEQEILDILSKKQVLAGTFGGKLNGGEVIVKEVGGLVTSNIEELISPYTLYLRNILNLQTFRVELVSDYEKTSSVSLAGFRPALTLETRPMFERLSLGSRLVAGEIYDVSPNAGGDNTYLGLTFRLNRFLGMEYRIDPYVDPAKQRILNHSLGLRAQFAY